MFGVFCKGSIIQSIVRTILGIQTEFEFVIFFV